MSENSLNVLRHRYLLRDKNGKICETPEQLFHRVAKNIAQADANYNSADLKRTEEEFYNLISTRDFLPNSPTLMNAGAAIQQLSGCFVLPIEDDMNHIYETIKQTALIHQSGGGTGFDFSRLRPKGDFVKSTQGVASGPISFLTVFNASTEVIKQGGKRRGANMGILRVDHPDILEFISCKQENTTINNFNISVALTDKFMEALKKNKEYSLTNPNTKKESGKLNAQEIFEKIINGAWRNGEPGIIFIDEINRYNPTPEVGKIESTNPCVTGDTLVSTEHGLMRMDKLVETFSDGGIQITTDNRVPIQVSNGNGLFNLTITEQNGVTLNKITKAFCTGIKDVYRLETVSGYELNCTADHKLLTNDGWVELQNIDLEKHTILIQSGAGKFSNNYQLPFNVINEYIGKNGRKYVLNLPDCWSKELGQVLGHLIGDGWLRDKDKNRRVGFTFGNDDKEVLEYLKPIINNFYGTDIKEVQRERNTIHLSYHSKYFVDFFKKLGVKTVRAESKRVPESIFTAPEEAVIGFLQGLFSADGTIRIHKPSANYYIRLTSKSNKLLKEVQILLLNLGIKSRIYNRCRAARTGFEYTTRKGEIRKYNLDGICFELNISRNNIPKFLEKIGFLVSKHREKIIQLNREFYTDKFEDKLKNIVYIGKKKVYDLTEPEKNSFIANGFVIHNCGEQPLLPYESCNLGSINLSNMVKDSKIDFEKLGKTVWTAVHFLDNVIDMNKFPLAKIEENTKANRKIGMGVMGFADMLIKLKLPYNSEEAVQTAGKVMKFITEEGRKASAELAKARGSFLNFEKSIYTKKGFTHLRNATVTTIAPTGSIGMIADVSSGIEPIFSLVFVKQVLEKEGMLYVNDLFEKIAKERNFYSEELMKKVADSGSIQKIEEIPEDVRKIFATSHDISPEWHIKMQAAFQEFTDNAVSKTINFPNSATREDIKKAYLLAYETKCKGLTVYRDGSREIQVIDIGKKKKSVEKIDVRQRSPVVHGITSQVGTGCGKLYITINEDEDGPIEVFARLGRSGGCAASQTEAIGRLISLAMRSGIGIKEIMEQLEGIRCPAPLWQPEGLVLSCPDAIAKAIKKHIGEGGELKKDVVKEVATLKEFINIPNAKGNVVGICPDCSGPLIHEEGCSKCHNCGFSKCG